MQATIRPPPGCTSGQSVCTSCLQAARGPPCGGGVASSAKADIATRLIMGRVENALMSFMGGLLVDSYLSKCNPTCPLSKTVANLRRKEFEKQMQYERKQDKIVHDAK